MIFSAIDFETADPSRDSACSVAAVHVEDGVIVERYYQLIRPPRSDFYFTHIHGISWDEVSTAPTFPEIWDDLQKFLSPSHFIAAHNAGFDRSVLKACCHSAGVAMIEKEFVCTVRAAKATWNLPSAKLNIVCEFLDIPLNHHNALSDAEACARILINAFDSGYEI